MIDPQQIQIIMQLLDNMEIASAKLEAAFNKKDAEDFKKAGGEILDMQRKISETLL